MDKYIIVDRDTLNTNWEHGKMGINLFHLIILTKKNERMWKQSKICQKFFKICRS